MRVGRNKKPGRSRVFQWRACSVRSGGLQRLDARGQAALVAGGLVLVDQAARAVAVEDRLGDGECGLAPAASLASSALSTFLTAVRSIERWLALRALRTTACLARFFADLMLATRESWECWWS